MEKILLEICADTLDSALAAMRGGADRVELCSALEVGGLTPSHAAIDGAVQRLDIPVNVLIRPRPGDFLYSGAEVELICADIRTALSLGAAGVVCGALDADGNLDMAAMERFVEAAAGGTFTFHRAFDLCRDPFAVLEQLAALGVDTVLTSGQAATAPEGMALLGELSARAAGRITVMAGCGLRPENIAEAAHRAGLRAVHLSAGGVVHSAMRYRVCGVAMGTPGAASEYDYRATDQGQVRACRLALDALVK